MVRLGVAVLVCWLGLAGMAVAETGADAGSGLASELPRIMRGLIDGIRLGLLVAVAAVGLTLIFATSRLVSFAHGELAALGALLAFFLNTGVLGPQLHLIPAAVIAIFAAAVLGTALELGVWRRLRAYGSGPLRVHATAIALAMFLHSILGLAWFRLMPGGALAPFHDYAVQRPLLLGPIRVTPRDLVVISLASLALAGVLVILRHSRVGKMMRAVADSPDLAASSGISVQAVHAHVWLLGGGLAALGGVFLGVTDGISAVMGLRVLALILPAVIVGGLGSVPGAIVGSLMVGTVAEVSALWVSADLALVAVLVVMAVVLQLRPQGLLARSGGATAGPPVRAMRMKAR